ncbi:MAG TPA: alpha-L-rhamnosidase C-terminal domain-containing protein, partial [Trebonia sp.]
PSVVERGLDAGAWQATLIEPSGGERGPAALLRREFTVPGPVAAARLYDATRERPGWSRPGFDDTGWEPARLGQLDPGVLVMPDGPPVRATEGLAVRQTLTTPSGKTVFDFGQTLFDKPARQLGDWLDPAAPAGQPWAATTDPHLVATAYRAHVASLLSRVAAVLGEEADAAKYAELADGVGQAFHDEYVTPRGRIASDSQTAYALALEFGLLRDREQRELAGARLTELVRAKGHHVATGFLGTPLTMTDRGGTTIWESWEGVDARGRPDESLNHYAKGAVISFLHRYTAGIRLAGDPGYRSFVIRPVPGGGLRSASAAYDSPYGRIESSWEIAGGRMNLSVLVPPGTRATVFAEETEVAAGPGRHEFCWEVSRQPAASGLP